MLKLQSNPQNKKKSKNPCLNNKNYPQIMKNKKKTQRTVIYLYPLYSKLANFVIIFKIFVFKLIFNKKW